MPLDLHRLQREFVCPKCHGRGAAAQEVVLGRVVAGVLPLPIDRCVALSCALCGYTELYNQAILEKAGIRDSDVTRVAAHPDAAMPGVPLNS